MNEKLKQVLKSACEEGVSPVLEGVSGDAVAQCLVGLVVTDEVTIKSIPVPLLPVAVAAAGSVVSEHAGAEQLTRTDLSDFREASDALSSAERGLGQGSSEYLAVKKRLAALEVQMEQRNKKVLQARKVCQLVLALLGRKYDIQNGQGIRYEDGRIVRAGQGQ